MMSPEEILDKTIDMGVAKKNKSLLAKCILGFIGGAMISLGYLAYLRVEATMLPTWGSFASFIGACVFPIGLIVILLAGGELLTGNMVALSASLFAKKVSIIDVAKNWLVITLANFVGAVFVAYFFGHIVGLTSSGAYLDAMLHTAQAKVDASFLQAFVSGIGCNWFVGLAVWLNYGAKSDTGKMIGIWFPVMVFVAIGFQHCVANMFVIPAAIFEGHLSWMEFFRNFVPVFLGNVIGGAVFVSGFYFLSYRHKEK